MWGCRGPVPYALGEREIQGYNILASGPMRAAEIFDHVVRAPHCGSGPAHKNYLKAASERLFVKTPRPEPGKV